MKQKLRRLGLEVVEQSKNVCSTTSRLVLPKELPSVEEALKDLAAAMNALKTPELNKTEIMRPRALIQTSSLYQKRFAEYVNYRKTEQRLIELTEKYEEMAKREQDRSVTPRIAGKEFTRSRTVLRNGPAGEETRTLVKAVISAVKTFLRSFFPFFEGANVFSRRRVWQEMKMMSRKIVNCPHCGKILSEEVWKQTRSLNQKTVKCPKCGSFKVWKEAIRHTALGDIQRYLCRDCAYRFSKK